MLTHTVGGSIPPNPENELKFWRDVPFKNTVKHHSGRLISMPPDGQHQGQWNVSPAMRSEVEAVGKGVFGALVKTYQIQEHRICW